MNYIIEGLRFSIFCYADAAWGFEYDGVLIPEKFATLEEAKEKLKEYARSRLQLNAEYVEEQIQSRINQLNSIREALARSNSEGWLDKYEDR